MATNLDIDPKLVKKVQRLSGKRTEKAAVTKALEEFIARREQRKILELFAMLDCDPELDYKAERFRT